MGVPRILKKGGQHRVKHSEQGQASRLTRYCRSFSTYGTFFTFSCSERVDEAAYFLAECSQIFVCAGGRSVCNLQCYGQQDEVLPRGSSSSSRGSVADPGPYPRPSCWRSVWSSLRASYNPLHTE